MSYDTVSKAAIKRIHHLGDAKCRRAEGLFKAEGAKLVLDTIEAFEVDGIYATAKWLESRGDITSKYKVWECTHADLERMSSLSTAPEVIAVYRIPVREFDPSTPARELILALDTIQDPGNLGTIIRVADWFGIHTIVCSRETVDLYNPKTVQATMGAMSRVGVHYLDLPEYLSSLQGAEVYGTFLDGENIYKAPLGTTGVIVIGNEGRGISEAVASHVTERLTIPSYPTGSPTSESLNAAIAAAITISTFRQHG